MFNINSSINLDTFALVLVLFIGLSIFNSIIKNMIHHKKLYLEDSVMVIIVYISCMFYIKLLSAETSLFTLNNLILPLLLSQLLHGGSKLYAWIYNKPPIHTLIGN